MGQYSISAFTGVGRPTEVEGLATFDKKVILFGSEGNAKVFESKYKEDAFDPQLWRKTNMPHAVVEVADCKMAGKPFFILWNILTTVVENDIIFLIIII